MNVGHSGSASTTARRRWMIFIAGLDARLGSHWMRYRLRRVLVIGRVSDIFQTENCRQGDSAGGISVAASCAAWLAGIPVTRLVDVCLVKLPAFFAENRST